MNNNPQFIANKYLERNRYTVTEVIPLELYSKAAPCKTDLKVMDMTSGIVWVYNCNKRQWRREK